MYSTCMHTVPPRAPNISVNSTSGEVCIIPRPNEEYPAYYYKLNITDVTGSDIYRDEDVPSTMPCITVDSLMLLECAPFIISVVGHNDHGDSIRPATKVVDAGKTTDYYNYHSILTRAYRYAAR